MLNFTGIQREIKKVLYTVFYGHFKKISEFRWNIRMPMLSLNWASPVVLFFSFIYFDILLTTKRKMLSDFILTERFVRQF